MFRLLNFLFTNGNMIWVSLLLVFCFDSVVSVDSNEVRSKLTSNSAFGKSVSDSIEKLLENFPGNEVISTPVRPLNEIAKNPISDDIKRKVTASSPDNDYQSMKRAFGTFNEKMDSYMNYYGSEMTFLTAKLNNLKDKLNTLEILHHEVDQVMYRQNTAEQKLQVIQESIFGSQSMNIKLDRLEVSIQQLHERIDELMETQRKFNSPSVQTKRNKNMDEDEQSKNCESKIEQLVGFVHSFAELNRLESADILNRLGNMQSQLIQFFNVKGPIEMSQRNANDTMEHAIELVEETNSITLYSMPTNDTNILKDAIEINSSDESLPLAVKEGSTQMPLTSLNANDDRKLSSLNPKSIRKRKRTTNMRNRARRHRELNTMNDTFHSQNLNQFEQIQQHDTSHTTQYKSVSNFDKPKIDIEIDYSAIKSDKQVSAKYGLASQNGCHEFVHMEQADEIHRFTTTNGISERLCSFDKNGTAWTVIQSRGQLNNSPTPEDFNRSWTDYKFGFGDLSGEFWYGNDIIHKLTYDDDMELKIQLEAWDNQSMEFTYEVFRVDSEENRYNLFVSGFRGDNKTLDSLEYHHNQDFSTFDRQNDRTGINDSKACCSCAKSYASGWWFNNCIEANLNGVYHFNPMNNNFVGIIWEKWLGDYSLKATKMMIRPKVDWFNANDGRFVGDHSKKPPDDP